MSGNANRSSQYLAELARNRTNYAHKIEIERQQNLIRRRNQNTDYSSELVESAREGSMAIYINGQIFLEVPTTNIPETPEIVSLPWFTRFFGNTNIGYTILNTNINQNYFISNGTYTDANSTINFYNKDGVSTVASTGLSLMNNFFIVFLDKNGNNIKSYTFYGLSTSGIGVINSNSTDFVRRIATSSNRIYNSFLYSNNTGYLPNTLIIKDISNTIVDTVKSSIVANRYDSLLVAYNSDAEYLYNISLRTTDLSDNSNTIFLPAISTFSNDDFIGSGYFRTNEIKAYLKKPGIAEQLLTTITLPQKTSQQNATKTNADVYTISFDKDGNFRHYNYMRGTNTTPTGGPTDVDTYILVDSNDNYYINGMFINNNYPNYLQFFNTSSTNTANVIYSTQNYITNGSNSLNSISYQPFIAKYDYNGTFKWFAAVYSSVSDLYGDFTYLTKQLGNGVVSSVYCGNSVSLAMYIYNGQTPSQKDTPATLFTALNTRNRFYQGDVNNIIVYYDENGQVQWVKNITNRPLFEGSIGQQLTNLPIVVANNNLYGAFSMLPNVPSNFTRLLNWANNSGITQATFTPDISGYSAGIYSLNINGSLNWYGTITHDTALNLSIGVSWIEKTSNNDIICLVRHNCPMYFRIYDSAGTLIKTVNVSKNTSSSINTFTIFKIPENISNNIQYIYCDNTVSLTITNHMNVDENNDVYLRFQNTANEDTSFNFYNQNNKNILSYSDTLNSTTKLAVVKIPYSFS
jgi:hypothetical protein